MASDDASALADSIIRNGRSLAGIEQMNSTVQALAVDWAAVRDMLDGKSRNEIERLLEAVRKQVIGLNDLCTAGVARLQAEKCSMQEGLKELGKGSQFLKSVKPVQSNFPKFIDSCC